MGSPKCCSFLNTCRKFDWEGGFFVCNEAGDCGLPGVVSAMVKKKLPGIPPVSTTAVKVWPDELLRASLPARCPVPGLCGWVSC